MVLAGVPVSLLANSATDGDTIPLQALQTANRTVELTWTSAVGTTTVYRQYPGESCPAVIASTEGSSWTDHQHRAVCGDTVFYSISRDGDTGFAAVMVSDNAPTAIAEWGVVTVADEQVRLQWVASADTDIMGYLVCEGNPSVVIDTVFGRANTTYNYQEGDVHTVYHFRLCAFDSCLQASPLTEVCNNIVLTLETNPCHRTVQASWNAYHNMPSGIGSYELWVSEDGGLFHRVAVAEADAVETSFEVSEACMSFMAYIKAISADGLSASFSNQAGAQFATAERPAYFYLRKVSVSADGKGIDIVAQTDPAFAGTDYSLYRTVGDSPASLVAHLSPTADGTLRWHDGDVDPSAEPCGYQFGVMDGCGRNEMRTATGYTILPELDSEGEIMLLSWNAYSGWTGATHYQIVSSPLDADRWQAEGDTWDNEYQLAAGDATRRYRVQAFEGFDSEHHRDDSLQSAIAFHRPYTNIWMPNAFTPTETNNNRVKPVSQYINPDGFSFVIFNRQGLQVFNTTSTEEAWDGRYQGVMQPNGAYTYKITYRQNDGTNQYITGTLMLVR